MTVQPNEGTFPFAAATWVYPAGSWIQWRVVQGTGRSWLQIGWYELLASTLSSKPWGL